MVKKSLMPEKEMRTKEKGRGFLLCLFRLVPSPRYFAKLQLTAAACRSIGKTTR
jgi:hypothetical protein